MTEAEVIRALSRAAVDPRGRQARGDLITLHFQSSVDTAAPVPFRVTAEWRGGTPLTLSVRTRLAPSSGFTRRRREMEHALTRLLRPAFPACGVTVQDQLNHSSARGRFQPLPPGETARPAQGPPDVPGIQASRKDDDMTLKIRKTPKPAPAKPTPRPRWATGPRETYPVNQNDLVGRLGLKTL